ncbi:ABC transporter substrate-binding protein [Nocardioides sp. zg-DK7169]|uniref:ABC transporter substrate-binding protein n=1 Tax=Nocardioides sp. zg-DK7169 TaxID=2736600 RepID=UPI0015564311|nr:ABC transporter substrate-binding protein [Nocardioides sp. zg-DK7169]
MKTTNHLRTRIAAVLCASALLATGCASDGSDDDEKGSDSALSLEEIYRTGLVDVPEADGDPVQGGTLTVAEYAEAVSLNPVQTYATGPTGMNVLAAIYDTLMRYDVESKTFEPRLAESLETADNVTWTLKLRDGVTFSDGTPLDADAVVGSIEYYMANYGFQGTLIQANLKSMKATDKSTVEFTFKTPWASFPNLLSSGPGLIMAPAAYKNPEKFQPIGAGPFVLKSQAQGEKTIVAANEDYVDGRPYLDQIEFVLVGADQAKWESLRAGEVDMAYIRQDDIVQDVRQAGYPAMVNAQSGVRILTLNAREGRPSADVRVRQAINYAIDAETYMERTTGQGELADRGLIAGFSEWASDAEPVETDTEKAKELLEEAKADGYDGKITYLGQSDATSKDAAVAVKAMLDAVGFEVELDLVNNVAEQTKKVYIDGDFDMAIGATSIPDEDVYSRLYAALGSASMSNPGRYANPKMDELLIDVQAAANPEEGAEAMAAVEELFREDVPYVSIAGGAFINAWGENVHGVVPTAETSILFDKVWIED